MLIADDDWDLADAFALRIKGLGLNAQTAHGALATLHALQNETPDLLILDVRMPDGNGLIVCETMALDPDLSRIPVLIITGLKDPITVRRCRQSGAQYVFKAPDVWQQIEPLILQQLKIGSSGTSARGATVHAGAGPGAG
ncbi:MAG: response regulator [Pirellulales bacterium]